MKAISVAVCWLDRGECNKRNVNMFYSMIQSINSHVRRLIHDKNQCESDFQKSREIMNARAHAILTQCKYSLGFYHLSPITVIFPIRSFVGYETSLFKLDTCMVIWKL